MVSRFTASQSVNLDVPGPLESLQAYLDQPERIVRALFDADRIQSLDGRTFRLQMQTLRFFMLQITPTVDLQVWTDSDHVLHINAVDCQLAGTDVFAHRFHLSFTGLLRPVQSAARRADCGTSCATGHADLAVEVMLPTPFAALSNSVLQIAGNKLLNGVLVTVKRRLTSQLSADYQNWAATRLVQVAATNR
ncbi:MAG: DUF1997 domain-containing protein [Cyanobacteria bacterium P01_A01_bin.135]